MGCTYQEVAESLGKPSAEAARKAAQRALVRLIAEMDQLASG
jgi:DNA-directed RNA polymerase specialized sigma24 family protein